MLTLFQVATFESWATAVLYPAMDVYPYAWIYFLTFIFLNAFIFLNMMIGIVLDVMQKESAILDLDNEDGDVAQMQGLRNDVRDLRAPARPYGSGTCADPRCTPAPRNIAHQQTRAVNTSTSPQPTDFRRAAMMLTDPAKKVPPLCGR